VSKAREHDAGRAYDKTTDFTPEEKKYNLGLGGGIR